MAGNKRRIIHSSLTVLDCSCDTGDLTSQYPQYPFCALFMTTSPDPVKVTSFVERLRNAGALDTDSAQEKLNKSLLMLATGLLCLTTMVWTGLYTYIGPQFSSTLPLLAQALLIGNALLYIKTQDFNTFRATKLSLMLFLSLIHI